MSTDSTRVTMWGNSTQKLDLNNTGHMSLDENNTIGFQFNNGIFEEFEEGRQFLKDIDKGYDYCRDKYPHLLRHCMNWYEMPKATEAEKEDKQKRRMIDCDTHLAAIEERIERAKKTFPWWKRLFL